MVIQVGILCNTGGAVGRQVGRDRWFREGEGEGEREGAGKGRAGNPHWAASRPRCAQQVW